MIWLLTDPCNYPTMTETSLQVGNDEMNFGEKVRELRKAKNLTLRELAAKVKVNFTYLSKIENHKLSFGEFPSEDLIRKLAKVLCWRFG